MSHISLERKEFPNLEMHILEGRIKKERVHTLVGRMKYFLFDLLGCWELLQEQILRQQMFLKSPRFILIHLTK